MHTRGNANIAPCVPCQDNETAWDIETWPDFLVGQPYKGAISTHCLSKIDTNPDITLDVKLQ